MTNYIATKIAEDWKMARSRQDFASEGDTVGNLSLRADSSKSKVTPLLLQKWDDRAERYLQGNIKSQCNGNLGFLAQSEITYSILEDAGDPGDYVATGLE